MSQRAKQQYQLLAHLVREIITDRFKRLAKDEVLSKFISGNVDPALLVDHYIQSEREAMDLAEMSLLQLVSAERLQSEIHKAAEKIQSNLARIYSSGVSRDFMGSTLTDARARWLRVRIDFYARWMSVSTGASSPKDLARDAFRNLKGFESRLESLIEADRLFSDELVRATPSMYRLLMKKQLDHEIDRAVEVWKEFSQEAFKEAKALPDS